MRATAPHPKSTMRHATMPFDLGHCHTTNPLLWCCSATLVALLLAPLSASAQEHDGPLTGRASYRSVIERVVRMPFDAQLRRRVERLRLDVVNVMWEDTGRFQGSAVGPNISDVTLQVRERLPRGRIRTHLLPVIRYPNFTDRTADVPSDRIWVRVGNHRRGGRLVSVPLTEVLSNLHAYLSKPESLRGDGDFLADRDTHFLVAAQHVFVPLPRRGKAEFTPVIFNYQSFPGSPAVLVLLATRQGLSATVVENRPGDQTLQGWGQQLFFNKAGRRTVFTAERQSAVQARIQRGEGSSQDDGALQEGADMVMIVQVPLVQRHLRSHAALASGGGSMEMGRIGPSRRARARRASPRSDVERAVIGHGRALGPFREMGGLRLVRDERFPIRITIQFYRATSNGVVSDEDLRQIKEQIDRVYSHADFVGSLVVGSQERPTAWERFRRRWLPPWRCRRLLSRGIRPRACLPPGVYDPPNPGLPRPEEPNVSPAPSPFGVYVQ